MDFINDKKHLRMSGTMLNSRYYNYVLTSADRDVHTALWNRVLAPNSDYYKRGQLVVNIKQETISGITGLSRSTVRRSVGRLNALGTIVTLKQYQSNNKYIMGFRTKGNEWLLFIYSRISKHEPFITEQVEDQLLEGEHAVIKNPGVYKMNRQHREFIVK